MATVSRGKSLQHEVEQALEQLRSLRDEIRVHLHLGSLDARQAWQSLEPALDALEQRLGRVTDEVRAEAKRLLQQFVALRDRLRGEGAVKQR